MIDGSYAALRKALRLLLPGSGWDTFRHELALEALHLDPVDGETIRYALEKFSSLTCADEKVRLLDALVYIIPNNELQGVF